MATRLSAPADGSRTLIVQDTQPEESTSSSESTPVGSLRLRGARRTGPRVVWSADVVDNEGAGKKKSKICCIYHKPRRFDESSSEESSSSSDSDSDSSGCRHRGHAHSPRRRRPLPQRDEGPSSNSSGSTRGGNEPAVVHQLDSDSDDANTYEKPPARTPKKGKNVARSET